MAITTILIQTMCFAVRWLLPKGEHTQRSPDLSGKWVRVNTAIQHPKYTWIDDIVSKTSHLYIVVQLSHGE